MFSKDYIVIDKYSLTTLEHISTVEKMPWVYTSLFDSQYLPVLDSEVNLRLNRFFNFSFPDRNAEPLYDARKILVLEHSAGDIIQFDCRNEISYNAMIYNPLMWRYFKDCIGFSEQLSNLKLKIDKMTSVTDAEVTKITGIQYNSDASFKSISIFDSDYDLHEYEGNESLSKVNELCKDNPPLCRGVLTLSDDNFDVAFKFVLNYPKKLLNGKVSDRVENYREHYVNMFLENQLIDTEQSEFIRNLLVGRTKFELEFLISESGIVKEIFMYHYKTYEFEDLTSV